MCGCLCKNQLGQDGPSPASIGHGIPTLPHIQTHTCSPLSEMAVPAPTLSPATEVVSVMVCTITYVPCCSAEKEVRGGHRSGNVRASRQGMGAQVVSRG